MQRGTCDGGIGNSSVAARRLPAGGRPRRL